MSASTEVQMPQYFYQDGKTYGFSVGDRVYGTISTTGNTVTYRFHNGNQAYEDSKEFKTENGAKRFAIRFAAEMRKADKRNGVLTSDTFRRFS